MNNAQAIKTRLQVDFFKEGKVFVAYCRALDLSSCGDTFEEAKNNFEEAMQIFFDEIVKMGTLEDVLMECGWQKTKSKEHPLTPPISIGNIEEKISIPYHIA
ncbi:MAG: type II toxin-antitoxin system HicB family antitoxin [bacterium]